MSAKWRVAVAGAGLIGARHIEAVLENPQCDLVAIIEPVAAIAAPYRDRGISVFADLEALGDDRSVAVDGMIVATPTALHREQALWALDRAISVLVEKPVADSVEAAKEICSAEKRSSARVLVGHHRRHHPLVTVLQNTLNSGVIGNPVTATMMWSVRKPDDYFIGNWRSAPDGSPVLINSVHDVDLLRFLFGDIVGVQAYGANRERHANRLETAVALLRFECGLIATLSTSDAAPSPWGFEMGTAENPNIAATHEDFLLISGSKASIAFPSLTVYENAPDWSTAPAKRRIDVSQTARRRSPLSLQLSHFLDVIAGDAEPLCSAEDGMKTLATTLEIEARARASAGLS